MGSLKTPRHYVQGSTNPEEVRFLHKTDLKMIDRFISAGSKKTQFKERHQISGHSLSLQCKDSGGGGGLSIWSRKDRKLV